MIPLLRSIGVLLLAMVAGSVVIALGEALGGKLFPLPPDVDVRDPVSLGAALEAGRIPTAALVAVLCGFFLGAFAAGWLAARLAGRAPQVHALLVGIAFLGLGITNLLLIPHPIWFAIATVLVFVPAALLGGKLARRPHMPPA